MPKSWKIILPIILLLLAAGFGVAYKSGLLGSHTGVQKLSDTSDGSLQSYLTQAQQLAPQNSAATTTVNFLAVGDIMLSRNVAAASLKAGDDNYPFEKASDLLKSTNFNFANLEGPVATGTPVVGGHSLVFGESAASLQSLKDYNFQIINLANNHAFDQGLAGIDKTISTLNNLGVTHEGAGDNLDQAWQPAVVSSGGLQICFVGASYASINDGGKTTNDYVARIGDIAHLQSAINTAKSECDFVVVTMHAGTEYTRLPNAAQTAFAHAAIDDGADVVIGAHPHWVQNIEKYKNKYIFYSLGNFIFDQAWSQDTMQGLTLKMTISKANCHPELVSGSTSEPGMDSGSGAGMTCGDSLQGEKVPATLESIQLIPVIITNSQLRAATPQETKIILNKIGETNTILKP